MLGLDSLVSEFAITFANPQFWLAVGVALAVGAVVLAFGTWFARAVGVLRSDAPVGETLAVGLATGLLVLAAWWAAVRSGAKSAFTPVAVGFAVALAFGLFGRLRGSGLDEASSLEHAPEPATVRRSSLRNLALTIVAAVVFVAGVAGIYGSTLALSPRDGVQPVEFTDEAYYSVLGRDLASTGLETTLSPSGFSPLPNFPAQVWYHWGELWLAAVVVAIFGTEPLAARHFVVLPLVLLAAAALTGTAVRLFNHTRSRLAYLFGALACLLLAPIQLTRIPEFSASNVGLIFGITTYGLAAVAVLLALLSLIHEPQHTKSRSVALFYGSTIAFLLPAHIGIAALAGAGVVSALMLRLGLQVANRRRPPSTSVGLRPAVFAALVGAGVTLAWGTWTGHGLVTSGAPVVSSFNWAWREIVSVTIIGGGAFFAIGIAWYLSPESVIHTGLYAGTAAILVTGALVWGARLGEFTMFHLFFGGIAIFGAPVAAIAVLAVWRYLRERQHPRVALWLLALCAIQMEFGAANAIERLQTFGPRDHRPIPITILDAIGRLPADAKLAYSCRPFEEISFANPRLLSIDAHTGRRVVSVCYAPETLSSLIGAEPSLDTPSLYFHGAPQMALFPNSASYPSTAALLAFFERHGIDYIYADAEHPNPLGDMALPVATSGGASVLRIQTAQRTHGDRLTGRATAHGREMSTAEDEKYTGLEVGASAGPSK